MASRVDIILRKWEYMKTRKQNFELLYQAVAHFVYYYKKGFTNSITPGEIQNADIYDSTALRNARVLASFIRSLLWPSGSQSFSIVAAEVDDKIKDEIKEFFEYATQRMREIIDSPRAGFDAALSEHLLESVVFGTSGVIAQEVDDVIPIRFKAKEVKNSWIAEDSEGKVNTLYTLRNLQTEDMVDEYGLDNVSEDVRKSYVEGVIGKTHDVLHIIEPRRDRNTSKKKMGVNGMPFVSIHIEIKTKKILKESGFEEFPVAISRFYKSMGEEYGRSPAIDVLPDVTQLNAMMEAVLVATEKFMNPPLGVMDDGRFGGGYIDTSPGAVNVFHGAGTTAPDKTVFPLYTVGDLKSAEYIIEKLSKNIDNAFAIDKLLDFNNEARMTLGEVNLRDKIQGRSLNEMLTRPEYEFYTPLLDRVFNICLSRGEFGYSKNDPRVKRLTALGFKPRVIPDAVSSRIVEGKVVYRIEYISPAKRLQMSEIVNAIDNMISFTNENSQVIPDALDNYDIDKVFIQRGSLLGISTKMVNSEKQVKAIRDGRAQARQAQIEKEDQERQAKIMASLGQMSNAGQMQPGRTVKR